MAVRQTAVTSDPFIIATDNYEGDYNDLTGLTIGQSYIVSINNPGDYITVRTGGPAGPLVAEGPTPLTFTATQAEVFIIYTTTAPPEVARLLPAQTGRHK